MDLFYTQATSLWSPNVSRFCPTPSNSLWHQLGILQFDPITVPSAWKYFQIPQVKGSVPRDCSHPQLGDQSQAGGPQVTHNFHPIWLQIRRSKDFLLGFNQLVQGAQRTYVCQFINVYDKRYRWRAVWRETRVRSGRVWAQDSLCPCGVEVHHPPYGRNPEALHTPFWGFYGGFIL